MLLAERMIAVTRVLLQRSRVHTILDTDGFGLTIRGDRIRDPGKRVGSGMMDACEVQIYCPPTAVLTGSGYTEETEPGQYLLPVVWLASSEARGSAGWKLSGQWSSSSLDASSSAPGMLRF